MEHLGERIVKARKKLERQQYTTLETGIYVGEKLINFSCIPLPDSKINLFLPNQFMIMPEQVKAVKYPAGEASDWIITSLDSTVNFCFDMLLVAAKKGETKRLSGQFQTAIKSANPSIKRMNQAEAVTDGGNEMSWFEFIGNTVSGQNYNQMYLIQTKNKVLYGSFSCPVKVKEQWQEVVKQCFMSIREDSNPNKNDLKQKGKEKRQEQDDIWITSRYSFGLPGSLLEQSMEVAAKNHKEHEEKAVEMMARYQIEHEQLSEKYVTRGSILSCIYGTHKARLDAPQDHGVYTRNDDPILTVDDSILGKNIFNFGICKCGNTKNTTKPNTPNISLMVDAQSYVNRGGVLQLEPLVGLAMANGPQCIPDITGEWKQVENQTMINHSEGKEYSAALKDTAILPCRYGGWIQVVEVYKGDAGTGQSVLYTTDSVQIRTAAGSANASVAAILKNSILITDLSDAPVQAADSKGNMIDWIKIRYFNSQDENNPSTWTWVDGWVVQDFTNEVPTTVSAKSALSYDDEYLSQANMLKNARYIKKYLLDSNKGWTNNAICGMLGNLETESNMSPGFKERGVASPGLGIVQWTPSTKYTDWANTNGYTIIDMDNQLERILYELDNGIQWQNDKHSSGMSFEDFSKSGDSPETLAELFLYCYEQPAVRPQIARCKQARKWHDILELLD